MKFNKQICSIMAFLVLGLVVNLMAFGKGYTINLIENPSFEVDDDQDGLPDCWCLVLNYPNDYYLDSEEKLLGDVSLKMETYCTPFQYYGEGGASVYLDVEPDTIYTISYYVKTDSPDSVLFHPGIVEIDAEGNGIRQHFTNLWLSPGWQRKDFTFTTAPNAAEIKAIAAVWTLYTESVDGWYEGEFYTSWIDGVQLEEGFMASPFHTTFISCPRVLPAAIDIDPDTLELSSQGETVTCYIELPEGFEVSNIDVSTILMDDTVYAELQPIKIADHDGDLIPDLMVKFDRQAVINYLVSLGVQPKDEVELTITGGLTDGLSFKGSDIIRVIDGY